MIIEKVIVGPMQANCYILGCARTSEAVVIDPGADAGEIKARLANYDFKVNCVINTHGHVDHIGADNSFSAPVYIHRLDGEFLTDSCLNLSGMLGIRLKLSAPDRLLEDGEKIKAGDIILEVLHTPGHTPGGICLNAGKAVFTGDTLFAQGVGRTDFPYASSSDLISSIRKKLFTLADEVMIYPGHGPSSTIGEEKKSNPFI